MTVPTIAQNAPYAWVILADANGNPLFFNVPSATSPATASNGTITTASIGIARITPVSNITGVIVQAGTNTGQQVIVENQSAFWAQMATSATSNVASGTSDYIAPNTAALYQWDSGNSLWYRVDPPLNIQPLGLYDGTLVNGFSSATNGTNTAYMVGIQLNTPVVVTGVRVRFGAGGTGHYDVGIYDDNNGTPNNRLTHAAATATSLVTSTAVLTPALIGGNLTLFPGRYWLTLWVDNATDTVFREGNTNVFSVVQQGTTTGPLPALYSSFTSPTTTAYRPILLGIVTNGWT